MQCLNDCEKDELIGQVFENKNGYKFVVTSFSHRDKGSNKHYNIRFIDSGYETKVWKFSITRGSIKDVYAKDIYGVACVGLAKTRDHWKEYQAWHSMIKRCYNKNAKSYISYGEKGVYVCDRWLCFEFFLEDIYKIEGYNFELYAQGKLALDKDVKSPHNNKHYSLETCQFISPSLNSKLSKGRQKTKMIAKSPSGESIEVNGVRAFSMKYGINEGNIYRVLNGKRNHVKGWTFERVDKDEAV